MKPSLVIFGMTPMHLASSSNCWGIFLELVICCTVSAALLSWVLLTPESVLLCAALAGGTQAAQVKSAKNAAVVTTFTIRCLLDVFRAETAGVLGGGFGGSLQ